MISLKDLKIFENYRFCNEVLRISLLISLRLTAVLLGQHSQQSGAADSSRMTEIFLISNGHMTFPH